MCEYPFTSFRRPTALQVFSTFDSWDSKDTADAAIANMPALQRSGMGKVRFEPLIVKLVTFIKMDGN